MQPNSTIEYFILAQPLTAEELAENPLIVGGVIGRVMTRTPSTVHLESIASCGVLMLSERESLSRQLKSNTALILQVRADSDGERLSGLARYYHLPLGQPYGEAFKLECDILPSKVQPIELLKILTAERIRY